MTENDNKITETDYTELMHAVMKNDVHAVKHICENNKDEINKQNSPTGNPGDSAGWSALHLACKNEKMMTIEIIKILIDAGSNVNLQNNDGDTALMVAIVNRNELLIENMVNILIEAGTDINIQSKDGTSALMYAVMYQGDHTANVIKNLINAKANLNLQSIHGYTALMIACATYKESLTENIIKLLIESGADLEIKDNKGYTVLYAAHIYELKNIVKMLVMKGADTDVLFDDIQLDVIKMKTDCVIKKMIERFEIDLKYKMTYYDYDIDFDDYYNE